MVQLKKNYNYTYIWVQIILGVLSQATKIKTYTTKNICTSASKDCSHREYLA